MARSTSTGLMTCVAAVLCVMAQAGPAPLPADAVYRNGVVFTADARDSLQQAIAVRAGRILYVGADQGVANYLGPHTTVHDLRGRMLMPGLVDGHMHPLAGGMTLAKCNLDYERLDVATLQARLQSCLDASAKSEPDGWLEAANWFQEAMIGTTKTSRATLDALKTRRPIMVFSSFGHTALVNSRALALAGIDARTVAPAGGVIERDAAGSPTGILQDAAIGLVFAVIPNPTPERNLQFARAALDALRRQGITTALDAAASEESLVAFAGVHAAGGLTARLHFAVHLRPDDDKNPRVTIARVAGLAKRFDGGPLAAAPALAVRNIKLFLDGVITAPALTGAMLEPYFENRGTDTQPRWVSGSNRGPEVYFAQPGLDRLLIEAAGAGFEPHLHADGDRAVREGLDAIEHLRKRYPESSLRAAIAHDEIVAPSDLPRFRTSGAVAVLSFQWAKPAPDTVEGARDTLGPARYPHLEPSGLLARAGARIAFGSDWPVDRLDEWLALKVAVTRTGAPEGAEQYRGRLGSDPGLSRTEALHAMTRGAAYELHRENDIGSLEAGKLADFIVLDRNALEIPAEELARIKVLSTVVGGRTVYEAAVP